jgi:hypothetical protein
MQHLTLAFMACVAAISPVFGQDTRTFPDQNGALASEAKGNAVEVDQKLLRKKLGAKDIKWDSKSGTLTLAYDFNKGQDKDWDIEENSVSRPSRLKGIRLAAATKIVHKAVFTEGTCTFQYALTQRDDKGPLLSAGDVIVRQHFFNDRSFFIGNKEANLGDASDGLKQFSVSLLCQGIRCSLKVNRSEVAFIRDSTAPFQFALHGGDNGGEFGSLIISGKPDPDWLAELMEKD